MTENEAPLIGLPREMFVPGLGRVNFGPSAWVRRLARAYMAGLDVSYAPIRVYSQIRPERARRIATVYDELAHRPRDPAVSSSYSALIEETLAQYELIKSSHLQIELIQGFVDPYRASPRLAIVDVVANNHLWTFPTRIGFGSGDQATAENNLMLSDTDEFIGSERLCANDVFRIVHDIFGHVKEGIGFRAEGEENAWRCHSAMYSRPALGAITTELRGQNNWLNYGPHGDRNRAASAADTIYAPQKNGLLPEWVWDEGRLDSAQT